MKFRNFLFGVMLVMLISACASNEPMPLAVEPAEEAKPVRALGEDPTEQAEIKAIDEAASGPTVIKEQDVKLDPAATLVSSPTDLPTEMPSPTVEASPTPEAGVRAEIDRLVAEGKYNAALKLVDPEGVFLWTIPQAERANLTPEQLEHTWVITTEAKKKVDERMDKLNELQKIIDEKKMSNKDYSTEQDKLENIEAYIVKITEGSKGNTSEGYVSENEAKGWLSEEMGLRGDELLDALQKEIEVSEEFWDPEKSPIKDSYPFFPASERHYVDVSYDDSGNLIVQWMEAESDLYEEAVARAAQ